MHMFGELTEGDPQAWGIGYRVNNSPQRTSMFQMLHRALDLDGFCGTTYTMENGHKISKFKCQESIGQAYRKYGNFLSYGIPIVFLKYIIKEYNLSMHNFNVTVVHCSYMFQLLYSNHHQVTMVEL